MRFRGQTITARKSIPFGQVVGPWATFLSLLCFVTAAREKKKETWVCFLVSCVHVFWGVEFLAGRTSMMHHSARSWASVSFPGRSSGGDAAKETCPLIFTYAFTFSLTPEILSRSLIWPRLSSPFHLHLQTHSMISFAVLIYVLSVLIHLKRYGHSFFSFSFCSCFGLPSIPRMIDRVCDLDQYQITNWGGGGGWSRASEETGQSEGSGELHPGPRIAKLSRPA